MAFDFSYVFRSVDKFSPVSKKVKREVEKVRKSILKARKAVGNTDKSVTKLALTFGFLGKAAGGLKRRMLSLKAALITGIAGVGIIAGFKKIIDAGTEFQDAMADLEAITGIVGPQLDGLGRSAKSMAKEFGGSPAAIVSAVKAVASAKSELIKVEGALEGVTKSALILKTAAGIEMGDAIKAVTLSLNQFGLSANDSNRVINVLAAGAKIGASEVFETTAAIRKSGVAAKNTNVSFEQLNSAIQVLAQREVKADIAGTGLRTFLLKLDLLFSKIAPNVTDFNKRLELLRKANLSNAVVMERFGLEAFDTARILISGSKKVQAWTKAVAGTNVAQEQAAIRLKTFSVRIKKLGAIISEKLIALFFKLEPKLIELTERFSVFLESITPETIEKFASAIETLVSALSGLVNIGSKAGSFLGFLVKSSPVLSGIAAVAGLGGAKEGPGAAMSQFANAPSPAASSSTVDVNINAPPGVVESVKSKSKGETKLNVGQNLGFATSGAF